MPEIAAEPRIVRASIADVPRIKELIDSHAHKGIMLAKPLSTLYETVRDFRVCRLGDRVIGIGALHILWEDLAEIRSLAVDETHRGHGIGTEITRALLAEASELGVGRVFALTYQVPFFVSNGFRVVDKSLLPRKVWYDCVNCHKFPMCDETAVIYDFRPYPEGIIGPPPEVPQLVNLKKMLPNLPWPESDKEGE